MPPSRILGKLALAALVVVGALFLAAIESGIVRPPFSGRRAPSGPGIFSSLRALPDSRVRGNARIRFNGETTATLQAMSKKSPEDVLEDFRARATREGKPLDLAVVAPGYTLGAYRDDKGLPNRLVAIRTPGGSAYYLGRGEKPSPPAPSRGDSPGADAGDIPRPPWAVRVFSIEKPDPPRSLMNLYESGGNPDDLAVYFETGMKNAGWIPNENVKQAIEGGNLPPLMAFSRPGRECLIGISEARGRTSVSVLSRDVNPVSIITERN
ncbi:MAG: hypothetical protein V1809_08585 [Planctomycetota bacterium]